MLGFLYQTEVIAAIIGAIVGGIIGILGSVSTFVISAILRNRGKLIVFTNESKILFHKRDNFGGYGITTEMKDAEDIEFSINIDVYNQSDLPKTIGDFKIELRNKKSIKYFPVKVYKQTTSGNSFSETVPTKTIFPKQSENIECKTFLQKSDLYPFDSTIDIYLLANFPDNKRFRAKVLGMNNTQ